MTAVSDVVASDALVVAESFILVVAIFSVADADTVEESELLYLVVAVDADSMVVTDIMGSLDLVKIKNRRKKWSSSNRRFSENIIP